MKDRSGFEGLDPYRLLFRGGRLWKKDGWRNVVDHQITQMKAAFVMSDLLQLSSTEEKEIVKVALVHDWEKRSDVKGDFNQEDIKKAKFYIEIVNPDQQLMESTGSDFLKLYLDGKSTLLQRIQFYLDDITKGSVLVNLDARIDEVSSRRPDLNEDTNLTQMLGGLYWDVERKIGHEVEAELWKKITEKGYKIDKPSDIPTYINSQLSQKVNT